MKKKKCLCIDIDSIVPLFVKGYLTGIGRTTLNLVEAIAEIQTEIPFEISLYSQNMKGIGGKNLHLSFKNKHLYFPNREKYNRIFRYFPFKELFVGCDIMHIPHNYESVYAPEKTIVTLHDAFFMKIEDQLFEYEKMRRIIPPFIQKCKAVITCSEYSKKDIVEMMNINPNKIHVIPWGIKHHLFFPERNLAILHLGLRNKFGLIRPYFLSVSCSEGRKNTPRLIEAYIQLAKKNPENDLCLVWNAPNSIRKQIDAAGLSARIHLIGNVNDESLRKLYCGATATIFPSLCEGFGLPVLESMACGTPVITSNVSSLPEVAGDAAIYIDPSSIDSIQKKLELFENNEIDKQKLINKGIIRAEQFFWKKCALDTISIYNKYLNE